MSSSEQRVACANCGEAAGPRFCPWCGQAVASRRGPLLEVGREALSDWMSLDSRLARSLRALARPGRLSELYVGGRRAPYLRPFRLYLLASLLLFSTLLTLEPPDATGLELWVAGERMGPATEGEVTQTLRLLDDRTLLDRWLVSLAGERVARLRALPRQEVIDLLFSGLRRVLPLGLFLFVPFLALALELLYVRGRAAHTLYLDHLVFALHFQSALFLALAAAWLGTRLLALGLVPSVVTWVAVGMAVLFVYLPLALRRFYRQSRRWTAVKTVALLYLYSRIFGLVLGLSVLVAVWRV